MASLGARGVSRAGTPKRVPVTSWGSAEWLVGGRAARSGGIRGGEKGSILEIPVQYARLGLPAPTGKVILPTLALILGIQILLSAIELDLQSVPTGPLTSPL